MLMQRKALYNLIQINLPRIESGELHMGDLQLWQKENYREKPTEILFQQLYGLGIQMDKSQWEAYGQSCEDPEEIVEALAKERDPLDKDQIYLIVFELWRRSFPEKRTLSIFCDELDNQMIAYDLEKPNQVADSLAYLQQILDDHVDRGLNPHKAFQMIQMCCANDITSFLFDYILKVIEGGNHSYATELLDGFKRYVEKTGWFDYLEARADILADPEEGYDRLEKIVKKVKSDTPLELALEMLFFLANTGNHTLFHTLAIKTLPLLTTESDFKDYLEACYSHYDYLELKTPALAIARLFHNRASIPRTNPLNPSEKAVSQITAILNQKIQFAEE